MLFFVKFSLSIIIIMCRVSLLSFVLCTFIMIIIFLIALTLREAKNSYPIRGRYLYSACLPKAYNMRAVPVLCCYEYKRRKVAPKFHIDVWNGEETTNFHVKVVIYGIRRVHTIFHKVSFVTVDMCKYCQDKHLCTCAYTLFAHTQNVRSYHAVVTREMSKFLKQISNKNNC